MAQHPTRVLKPKLMKAALLATPFSNNPWTSKPVPMDRAARPLWKTVLISRSFFKGKATESWVTMKQLDPTVDRDHKAQRLEGCLFFNDCNEFSLEWVKPQALGKPKDVLHIVFLPHGGAGKCATQQLTYKAWVR